MTGRHRILAQSLSLLRRFLAIRRGLRSTTDRDRRITRPIGR